MKIQVFPHVTKHLSLAWFSFCPSYKTSETEPRCWCSSVSRFSVLTRFLDMVILIIIGSPEGLIKLVNNKKKLSKIFQVFYWDLTLCQYLKSSEWLLWYVRIEGWNDTKYTLLVCTQISHSRCLEKPNDFNYTTSSIDIYSSIYHRYFSQERASVTSQSHETTHQ